MNRLDEIPSSTIADIKIAIWLHMKAFDVHTLKYSAFWDKSGMVINFDFVECGLDMDGLRDALKKCGAYILRNNYVQKIIVCCEKPLSPKDIELILQ